MLIEWLYVLCIYSFFPCYCILLKLLLLFYQHLFHHFKVLIKVHSNRNVLMFTCLHNKFITFGLLRFSIFSLALYIYIYIYIYRHAQTDCFVLPELFSVPRQARFPKLWSKPGWLKRQSKILPLSHEETSESGGNLNAYVSHLFLFYIYPLNDYRDLDSFEEPYITQVATVYFLHNIFRCVHKITFEINIFEIWKYL